LENYNKWKGVFTGSLKKVCVTKEIFATLLACDRLFSTLVILYIAGPGSGTSFVTS
jgi:hypothetical protein